MSTCCLGALFSYHGISLQPVLICLILRKAFFLMSMNNPSVVATFFEWVAVYFRHIDSGLQTIAMTLSVQSTALGEGVRCSMESGTYKLRVDFSHTQSRQYSVVWLPKLTQYLIFLNTGINMPVQCGPKTKRLKLISL